MVGSKTGHTSTNRPVMKIANDLLKEVRPQAQQQCPRRHDAAVRLNEFTLKCRVVLTRAGAGKNGVLAKLSCEHVARGANENFQEPGVSARSTTSLPVSVN